MLDISGQWEGTDSEGGDWRVEVEADCFDTDEGLVVSLWVKDAEANALATIKPSEARSIARSLIACADHVEAQRATASERNGS